MIGCYSLKTGGFLIAILELIGGIVGLYLTPLPIPLNDFENKYKIEEEGSQDTKLENGIQQNVLSRVRIFTIVCYAAWIVFSFQIIFSILLIKAIQKNSRLMLKVWMVIKTIFIVIGVVILIVMCFNNILNPAKIIFSTLALVLYSIHVTVVYGLKVSMTYNHERFEDED